MRAPKPPLAVPALLRRDCEGPQRAPWRHRATDGAARKGSAQAGGDGHELPVLVRIGDIAAACNRADAAAGSRIGADDRGTQQRREELRERVDPKHGA